MCGIIVVKKSDMEYLMNDYKNFCEFVSKPKPTAKNRAIRAALIIFYTIFSAFYIYVFWLNLKLWTMILLLPFLMYAIIRMSWRFVQLEYEYAIEAGELSVAAIYSGASRRTKFRAQISDMTLIAPYNEQNAAVLRAHDITSAKIFADRDSETAYICVCPDKASGKKRAAVIETNDEMCRILRLGNPSAFKK